MTGELPYCFWPLESARSAERGPSGLDRNEERLKLRAMDYSHRPQSVLGFDGKAGEDVMDACALTAKPI